MLHAATVVVVLWYALSVSPAGALVAFAIAISSEAALCYVSRPFTLRIAFRMNGTLAAVAVLPGVAAAFITGILNGVILIAGSALLLRLAQAWYHHRPGGLTDYSLPVAGLMIEAFTLSYLQRASFPLGQ